MGMSITREEAEALLDAAGYPRGSNSYRFKVTVGYVVPRFETTYAEVICAYWDVIGVNCEIYGHNEAEWMGAFDGETHDWDLTQGQGHGERRPALRFVGFGIQNDDGKSWTKSNDSRFATFFNNANNTADLEVFFSNIRKADELYIREHWGLVRPRSAVFQVAQPWVEGWHGEWAMGYAERHTHFSRLWIDSALKKEMMGN